MNKTCPSCKLSYDAQYPGCPLCQPLVVAGAEAHPPSGAVSPKRHLRYIQRTAIRKLVGENGKRCSEEALMHLDEWIGRRVIQACKAHNGGRKTIDACVLGQVGVK